MADVDLSPIPTGVSDEMAEALHLAGLCTSHLRAVKKGRTSRVWIHEKHGYPSVIVKYSDARRGTPVFPNEPLSEWRAMRALSDQSLCPFPLGRHMLSNGAVLLISQYIPPTSPTAPQAIAALMRQIHAVRAWPQLPSRITSSEALRAEGAAMLEDSDCPAWLVHLSPEDSKLSPAIEPTVIHRDLVPANIAMKDAKTAVALDWQCPALGDPCEDIAHASSPGMQSLSPADPLLSADALLDAYGDAPLTQAFLRWAPYYRWRMACYCQWQVSRGEYAYATALTAECDALEEARKNAGSAR